MADKTIMGFRVYKSVRNPIYNYIAGDSPNIVAGCEIIYESKLSFDQIFPKIANYLKENKNYLKESKNLKCNSTQLDRNQKYKIFTSKGEGYFDIIFISTQNNQTVIRASVI
jgi:hypothetical protein